MSKQEMINMLVLLSQMEGFILGKVGVHTLPDYVAESLSDMCELLAEKIKESNE